MTDKEIFDKYIDIDKSCLMEKEKKEVMDMLYRYKEAFTGGSHLSHTVVQPDSCLAQIFVAKFLCIIKLIIIG